MLHRKVILLCENEAEKIKALDAFIGKDILTLAAHANLQKITENKDGLLPIFKYILYG